MLWPLSSPSATAICKICGCHAPAFDSCDINRGGPPGAATRPQTGQALMYHLCTNCGFMFATQLDHWQPNDFAHYIYNERYVDVDPDYEYARPMANAAMLLSMLGQQPASFRLLDFGAGSGFLAQQLRAAGMAADSEDPYSKAGSEQIPQSAEPVYDVVCAFEVLEHSPNPLHTLALIKARLKPGGRAIISTLLQPVEISEIRCNWWYCAPRNGHISLFSKASLEQALRIAGATNSRSLSPILHLVYF